MESIFSKIVRGEIPCFKIAEDENCMAFLDISPLVKGHTLVIPKKQVDYLFDLEDDLYIRLQLFAKKIAKGIKLTIPCTRIGVTVVGLEVPHAHIHLIPINGIYDMDFKKGKLSFTKEEFSAIAEAIKENV